VLVLLALRTMALRVFGEGAFDYMRSVYDWPVAIVMLVLGSVLWWLSYK